MKKVLSAKDIEAMLREGADLRALPADAILTPSARDLVSEAVDNLRRPSQPSAGPTAPAALPKSAPGSALPAKSVSSSSPKSDLEAFFNSPDLQRVKESICEIGRRLWQRAYVDGNGGNIAVRVGPDLVLCTPTLVSKGFLRPADLCLVDLEGNQLAGTLKRTSEILMHLQIMKRQPRAVATVHCHPPHATAFAVAGLEPPTCLIPELEVFVGRVPVAPYRTPGTPEMGQLVADLVEQHNTILMGNHGAVSWSHLGLEDAYFKMEILEAYCRTIWVASQLGAPLKSISPGQLQDLLKIKQNLGIPDPRIGLKECELCDNSDWRPGVVCQIPGSDGAGGAADPEAERMVEVVTDLLMEKLASEKRSL